MTCNALINTFLSLQAIRVLRGANYAKRQGLELEAKGLALLEEAVACTAAEDIAPMIRSFLQSSTSTAMPSSFAGASFSSAIPARMAERVKQETKPADDAPPTSVVTTGAGQPSKPIPREELVVEQPQGAEKIVTPPVAVSTDTETGQPSGSHAADSAEPKKKKRRSSSNRLWKASDLPVPETDVKIVDKINQDKTNVYGCPFNCNKKMHSGDIFRASGKEQVRAHVREIHYKQAFICGDKNQQINKECTKWSATLGYGYRTTNADNFARHANNCGSGSYISVRSGQPNVPPPTE